MAKHWIKDATKNKGALHRNLGVPEGEDIPEDKLRSAAHSKDPKVRKEATLAATLKGMSHETKRKEPKHSEMMKSFYNKKK